MFKVDEYGSLELAKAAAERYRCEISLMLGKTKNQYRYMKDLVTGLEYIEVKLTKRYVTKIDTEDLPKVEARKWRAEVGEKGHVYARSDPRSHKGEKYTGLHNVIIDAPMVDHIFGDTLDNRKSQIRPATAIINNRNRSTRASHSGQRIRVGVYEKKTLYEVQYQESRTERTSISFSFKKYGKEEALRLAIEAREEADRRLGIIIRPPKRPREDDDLHISTHGNAKKKARVESD